MQKFISEREREIWIKETETAINKIKEFNKKYPQYADHEKLQRQESFLNECKNNYKIIKAV